MASELRSPIAARSIEKWAGALTAGLAALALHDRGNWPAFDPWKLPALAAAVAVGWCIGGVVGWGVPRVPARHRDQPERFLDGAFGMVFGLVLLPAVRIAYAVNQQQLGRLIQTMGLPQQWFPITIPSLFDLLLLALCATFGVLFRCTSSPTMRRAATVALVVALAGVVGGITSLGAYLALMKAAGGR